jgi:tetratricopeptide (TPR) repeat protein
MQKMLPQAEEQHLWCLRAVQAKKVTDQNLKFSIYRNLANDYWAADKFDLAISVYNEALKVFDDLYDPLRLAGLHWGLAAAYKSAGDLPFAKIHLQKALAIYRQKEAHVSAAMMAMNLAEALMDDGQYPEAEESLKDAEDLLEQEKANTAAKSSSATMTGMGGDTTDPLLLCNLYKDYAILARGQGQLEKGAEYATQSMQLSESVYGRVAEDSIEASAYPARHYAQALHIGALIGEDLGHRQRADQLFGQAISVIEPTGIEETHKEILRSYGEVLKKRGEFERASQYLYKAAQIRIKANRTNNDI